MLFSPTHPQSSPARVVVTGAGIVTALGRGWRANADGFRSGRRAFRPVTLFDVSRQRAKIAAEVDLPPLKLALSPQTPLTRAAGQMGEGGAAGGRGRQNLPALGLSPKQERRLDRATRMLLLATHEAWTQSGWKPAENLPLVLGTTSGGMALGEDYLRQAVQPPHALRGQATRVVSYQAQQQGLDLCDAFDFSGPITIIANACASGANAIGHAWELVRHGQTDRALAGGHDALCQLTFAGFDALQALSPTPCRPFDAKRDGLSLGEGAAMLALETLECARRRDAEILGEIIGYAAATDTHHLTQPHPEGRAALATMTAACAVAGVTPDQLDYVNAHGTATPQNDATEAAAIAHWAGASWVAALRVSSAKASIGHLLGAAGAVEAVVTLMALREQWLPPQSNGGVPDPVCRFQIVREPTDARVEVALSNSFGFGGANATLVLRRWS